MTTSKAAGNTAMASGNRLINGDCLEVMRGIPDGSIDAVITDPPYHSTHLKFDQAPRVDYGAWLEDCRRVLKPSGVLVSFCDLNLLIELRRHKAFKTAYELIWEKTAAVGFLDANRRPLRSHEYMLVMVNGLNRATYNPQKTAGTPVKRVPRTRGNNVYSAHNDGGQYINPTGARHPASVIKSAHDKSRSDSRASHDGIRHPTQKPVLLSEWLVKSYTNAGDLVLDPFMGSGTTGVACQNTTRRFIGIEKDAGYFAIAQRRVDTENASLL